MFEEERAELLRYREEAIEKEREIKRRKRDELAQLRRFVELRLSEIQVYNTKTMTLLMSTTILKYRLKSKSKNYKGNKEHCYVLRVQLVMDQLLGNIISLLILIIPVSIPSHIVLTNLNTIPHRLTPDNSDLNITVHHPMFSNSKVNTISWQ